MSIRSKKLPMYALTTAVVFTAVAIMIVARSARSKATEPVVTQTAITDRHSARNLSLQPEALKLSRRLGNRFSRVAEGSSHLSGQLTIGTERQAVTVVRNQNNSGESVEVAIGSRTLSWNAVDGVRSSPEPAPAERLLVERLTFDSPDQFVLAQLRGASYYSITRNARPEEAGGDDNYTGPVWDLVRVAEPSNARSRPQSVWRLYYINTVTGLIDKIVSEEQGVTVTAEVSVWVEQAGETVPTRIVWKRNNQPVMEFSLSSATHATRQ